MISEFDNSLDSISGEIVDTFQNALAVIGSTNVYGLFEKEYREDLEVIGGIYTFTYTTTDFPAPATGMSVVIDAQNYEIYSFDDDMTGVILLNLVKV